MTPNAPPPTNGLRPVEAALVNLMVAVTDACCCRDWADDTATMVWQLAWGRRDRWGLMQATEISAELDAIRASANAAGVWVDLVDGRWRSVPLEIWEAVMSERVRRDQLPGGIIDAMTDAGAAALIHHDHDIGFELAARRRDGASIVDRNETAWLIAHRVLDAARPVLERYLGIGDTGDDLIGD